jgi:hypothetical protein
MATALLRRVRKGDGGGFGIGQDLTWNARAEVGWNGHMGSKESVLSLGYRALGLDNRDDGARVDIILHGLTLS